MKKFTCYSFLVIFSLALTLNVSAQKKRGVKPRRCGTDEMIQNRLLTDPAFKAHMEEGQRQYEASKLLPVSARTTSTTTLTNPVIIPVVVHIVLPDPTIVTDADVLYFINRLNIDYSGLNPDSTNGTSFYNVRGHSLLRFTLAKRDPSGLLTTGIERKVGAGTIALGNPQSIKTAASGLAPWDITQYYNIWVGDGSANGLLGISPEIGPGGATGNSIDGVCVDVSGFSHNTCYSDPAYNKARTAVHEIGHNFGLYHNFQGACAGSDFGQLSSVGCSLPASLLAPADDVPVQSASSTGLCPVGNVSTGCVGIPNPPGKMYQCYMDYTDDACYSMFSKGEVSRMEWVLENCRAGYLTTLGGTFPASAAAVDASATAVVSPGGFEVTGTGRYTDPNNNSAFTCATYTTPTCAGVSVTPKIRIANRGTSALTTLAVSFQFNGGTVSTQSININLPYMYDTVITFTAVTTVAGANVFKYWVANPNGGADPNHANDTITKTVNIAVTNAPYTEGFQGAAFPPTGWSRAVFNVGATQTAVQWDSTNAAGSASTISARARNYATDNTGQIADMFSLPVDVSNSDSIKVEFDVAAAYYYDATVTPIDDLEDTLQIGYSRNCGVNYFSAYKKWGAALSTIGPAGITTEFVPTPAQWRKDSFKILGTGQGVNGSIILLIRNKGVFGNNIYLDNINITKYQGHDIQVTAVSLTGAVNCGDNISPKIDVKNNGFRTITGFKGAYKLDGTTTSATTKFTGLNIVPGGTATGLTLASVAVTTPGSHSIKAYSVDSIFTTTTNELDKDRTNDTATTTFNAAALPTPAVTISGINGVDLVSSSASGNQWYLNGNPLGGATGQTYTPTQNGNYTVQVTVNGCQSAISNTFNYQITGTINLEPGVSVMVAPNPVTDNLYIRTTGQANNLKLYVRLFNIEGKTIVNRPINNNDQVNMSGLAAGVYMLELRSSNKKISGFVKIVKK